MDNVTILFVSFLVMLFLGIPIAFSLGVSSFLYLYLADIPLIVIPQKMFSGMDVFSMLCIPGFILAGNLMNQGGISERIIRFCNCMVGHIRGGLAQANIIASMIFAGISGTAIADTASLGAILIPAMEKEGYDVDFSCAVTAASSCIGPIIPPSMPMIIAGTLTGLSVGRLFIAGAIPGILLGLALMAMSAYLSKKRNYPKGEKASWKQLFVEFYGAFWSLLMTVIILYGILGGYFSPTEASMVACLYGLLVGLFIYRELKVKALPGIIVDTAVTAGSVLVLVGFANLFAWILASEQIPQMIAKWLLGITTNKYLIILLINLLLLFVGMFMETIAALLTLFPTLLAVALQVGIDPIHFAMIAVLNLILGLTTPPIGVCLFVSSSIGRISVSRVAKANIPFLIASLEVLLLVSYMPALSTWLPGMLMK